MHLETALADSRAQLAALQQHARDATSQHSREVERLRVEQEAALEHAREEDALALQTLREEVDARSVQVAGELKAWEAQVLGRADATRSHLEKEVVNVRGQMEKALKDAEEKRRSDLKELEERAERERLEAVEAVLSDSQLHMFAKEQDLRSAGDKIRELEAQVVALSSPSEPVSVSNMKLEVAQLTSALMTVKLEKASLETEAKHWKSEYEAVFSSFQEKSESLQALEADCAAKSTQIDVMKDELIVKKDSCASLMASLAHSQKDLEACREENSTVASAMAQLEADVSALLSKMSDRKAKYASNLAALKEESAAKLAQSVSSLRAELESQHSTEIAVLIEEHQTVMRGLRKEFSRTGLEKTSEAQSKMDEAEARMEAMERANAREVEKAQRAAKAAVQEDIKDLEARLEEAELVGTSWKRDAERLQKALHRAIEMGKQSLLDYEKEVDGERDLWDVERKTLKGRIQLLETRLATISETLKTVSSQSHKASLSDDVHKSIMIKHNIPRQYRLQQKYIQQLKKSSKLPVGELACQMFHSCLRYRPLWGSLFLLSVLPSRVISPKLPQLSMQQIPRNLTMRRWRMTMFRGRNLTKKLLHLWTTCNQLRSLQKKIKLQNEGSNHPIGRKNYLNRMFLLPSLLTEGPMQDVPNCSKTQHPLLRLYLSTLRQNLWRGVGGKSKRKQKTKIRKRSRKIRGRHRERRRPNHLKNCLHQLPLSPKPRRILNQRKSRSWQSPKSPVPRSPLFPGQGVKHPIMTILALWMARKSVVN
ncbi:hypothetical protein BC830DRAFT_360233 [Chytriomyces sp. MP71]|nr:hypothetical protein BC830DRAFT_360233 [Chytriomyces sp. MP71]